MVKNMVKAKIEKIDGILLFIDAEWMSGNIPVSVQVSISIQGMWYDQFIVINEMFKDSLDCDVIEKWSLDKGIKLVFMKLGDHTNAVLSY